jgi:polysaccharide export outer membrane protein
MKIAAIFSVLAVLGLVGCARMPTAGPTRSEIFDQAANDKSYHFNLVEIDQQTLVALAARPKESLVTEFNHFGKPPNPRVGIGDTVAVTIWQSAAGGGTNGASSGGGASAEGGGAQTVVVPEQVVGADGGITVPYVGRVVANGRTPAEIGDSIEHLLAERIVVPQVLVTVPKGISGTATVLGEVVSGARVPLSGRGDRLLEVIASAGGAKSALYETDIRLSRNEATASISMDRLVSDPHENVYVWPGDIITLVKAPQTFSVFGATQSNMQLPFNADHLSLAQAVARAGGLTDMLADPEGVFLFRFEPQPVATALNIPASPSAPSEKLPVLYHLNLRNASGYFLASHFPVQDDDIIYVAGASTNSLQKFLTLLSSITGPVVSGALITRGAN